MSESPKDGDDDTKDAANMMMFAFSQDHKTLIQDTWILLDIASQWLTSSVILAWCKTFNEFHEG